MIDSPFIEAVKHLAGKDVLPTALSSADLSQIDAAIRRQSIFSARTLMGGYLDEIKSVVGDVLQPRTETREDRITEANPPGNFTAGINPAAARVKLKAALEKLGYAPAEGEAGTIKDLSSDARINLVVKTNVQLAQGAGKFIQGNADLDVVDLYPAWELVRYEDRAKPRDWEQRWKIAAQVAGDALAAAALELHGRMAALKSSGIWQALGEGAGGYTDGLDNPYPPFAFNSGMWTDDVSRDEAVELGLIGEDDEARPAPFDLASLFKIAA